LAYDGQLKMPLLTFRSAESLFNEIPLYKCHGLFVNDVFHIWAAVIGCDFSRDAKAVECIEVKGVLCALGNMKEKVAAEDINTSVNECAGRGLETTKALARVAMQQVMAVTKACQGTEACCSWIISS